MTEDRRPAKRLAPTLAPEACCPHEFTANEGLQLEVDCGECGGAQDLTNRRCLVGIVNIVARCAVPDTIILKRFMHKRYRAEAVRLTARAASELSALTRASSSASIPSDRRCRTCACGTKRLVSELRRTLLEDPGSYAKDRGRAEAVLEKALTGSVCERRHECADHARSASIVLGGPS